MLSGQSILLSVTSATRVSYVRKQAQQEFGIAISTVSLRGEVLDSEGTLEGAGVQANDTLYVTVQRCRIFSNQHAGAFACLKADGTVETWGDMDRGGDSNSAQPQLQYVQDISASSQAFAAITNSGKVVTWGHHMWGGDSKKVRRQLVGVRKIAAASAAFAALRKDATVVTWGLFWWQQHCSSITTSQRRSDNCRKVCICSSLQRWVCSDMGQQ